MALLLQRFLGLLQHDGVRLVGQADVEPLPAVQISQVGLGDRGALGQLARAAVDGLADQQLLDTVELVVLDDAQLVVQVLAVAAQFIVDDGLARLSRTMPSRVNTCTSMTVPVMPEGTRSEVSLTSDAFSPKMARSSFFRRQLGLALGVTLPTSTSSALTSAPM